MRLKQLWDTAPMKTSKKISLVVAVISAVFLDVGIQLIGMGVRGLVPIEFLYITPSTVSSLPLDSHVFAALL